MFRKYGNVINLWAPVWILSDSAIYLRKGRGDSHLYEKKDIFDRIMQLPGLRIFEPFYKAHKEVLMYLFFGVLTTVVSIASYAVANAVFGINELIANVISWILAVTFAFFTNRTWVFDAGKGGTADFIRQMLSFYGGRLFTLLVEEVLLFVFITVLKLNSIGVKVGAQFVIVVLNYVISKLVVFKKKKG